MFKRNRAIPVRPTMTGHIGSSFFYSCPFLLPYFLPPEIVGTSTSSVEVEEVDLDCYEIPLQQVPFVCVMQKPRSPAPSEGRNLRLLLQPENHGYCSTVRKSKVAGLYLTNSFSSGNTLTAP